MNELAQPTGSDSFKQTYQHYRRYVGRDTDFSSLVDLRHPSPEQLHHWGITPVQVQDTTVYRFNQPEGALLIKGAMPAQEQIEVALSCLNEYVHPPYRTSLFIYEDMSTGLTPVKKHYDQDKYVVSDFSRYSFNKKVRWANVGWHYDWELRQYLPSHDGLTPLLKQVVARHVSMLREAGLVFNINDYSPESTIINFYDPKDHMGGHLDDGEPDQTHPIFSYNMGLSAVFLIGGPTKDTAPLPVRLDSGDLFIMSGPARHCYHGVPRVIENSYEEDMEEWLQHTFPDEALDLREGHQHKYLLSQSQSTKGGKTQFRNTRWHAWNYLRENRLNLTFRQVFL